MMIIIMMIIIMMMMTTTATATATAKMTILLGFLLKCIPIGNLKCLRIVGIEKTLGNFLLAN